MSRSPLFARVNSFLLCVSLVWERRGPLCRFNRSNLWRRFADIPLIRRVNESFVPLFTRVKQRRVVIPGNKRQTECWELVPTANGVKRRRDRRWQHPEKWIAVCVPAIAVEASLARCVHDDRRLVDAYVAGAFTAAELKAYCADVATRGQAMEAHRP